MTNHTAIIDPPAAALDLRWLGSSVLRGCNVHHVRTVLRVRVDLGVLHGRTSASAGTDFAERFVARFCDAARTPPTAVPDMLFYDALHSADGAPFEQVLLEAILAVERRLAFARFDFVPITMARVEHLGSQRGSRQVRLVWETRDPAQSRAAAQVAFAGVQGLLYGPLGVHADGGLLDFDVALSKLVRRASNRQAPPSTAVIEVAARARGIPFESVGGPHLQLGHGAAQRMVYSSVPADVSLGAAQLSRNKRSSTRRLQQLGLPVTRQISVGSAEEALAAAAKLGYPVAIKPLKGHKGAGVTVDITDPAAVVDAFGRARLVGTRVLVEDFVQGTSYRLLAIGGRFVAAASIAPPTVVGDGTSRIDELIEALNRDPLRNGVCLCKVDVDAALLACLARGGRTLADVPAAGIEVALRTAANISLGGVHTDVTDLVHASQRELAERAATAIGLSVAGIDVVSRDIGRPSDEAGTRIIEVNARPGVDAHVFPRYGKARDVAGALIELVFPPGATGRIPTALVLGQRGAGAIARGLDALFQACGRTTGLITRKAALAAGRDLSTYPTSPHEALTQMHHDPRLQALVVATSPRRAVAQGLALESADAVALLALDVQEDARTYGQAVALAVRAARRAIVVEASNDTALLHLEALVAAGDLDRKRLILTTTRVRHRAIAAHVAAGATAVAMASDRAGDAIIVSRGKETLAVLRGHASSGAGPVDGRSARARVRLMAVALGWGLGLTAPQLEKALSR